MAGVLEAERHFRKVAGYRALPKLVSPLRAPDPDSMVRLIRLPPQRQPPRVAGEISDMNKIIARWQDWSGSGIEHLLLKEGPNQIAADAAILGTVDDNVFAARYQILCDASWRVKKVENTEIGSDLTAELASDGVGNWVDGSATALPQLGMAIDIDISITPFTNTLPIRRLNLQRGQSEEILAVYIRLPSLAITTDRQQLYVSRGRKTVSIRIGRSDFTRGIEVDGHGLVVTYPGLFRRVS